VLKAQLALCAKSEGFNFLDRSLQVILSSGFPPGLRGSARAGFARSVPPLSGNRQSVISHFPRDRAPIRLATTGSQFAFCFSICVLLAFELQQLLLRLLHL
jgi:hypothetical protein